MEKHDLPLPDPPGGYIRCNKNEFCYADMGPGPGKPLYQCVPDDPPTGDEAAALATLYVQRAHEHNLPVIESKDGRLGFASRYGNFLFSDIDYGCRILHESNDPFAGLPFIEALEAVARACSEMGYEGKFLKLPSAFDKGSLRPGYMAF